MSNPVPTQTAPGPAAPRAERARAAIAQAARATGTNFGFLVAQAKLESGMNPQARARTSSASGLYQFIDSTWLRTLDRHGAAHGLSHLSDVIEQRGGRAYVRDPAVRQQIMALRHDPEIASVMAGALAQDNRAVLVPVLGREPDAAELYLAHFLGAGGAAGFLRALASNPHAPAAALLPEAAGANRAIFYAGGEPRSLSQVMEVIRRKMGRAMEDEGGAGPTPAASSSYGSSPAGWSGRLAGVNGDSSVIPPQRSAPSSMSRLLEESFGLEGHSGRTGNAAPAHVQAAYGKLKAFAL